MRVRALHLEREREREREREVQIQMTHAMEQVRRKSIETERKQLNIYYYIQPIVNAVLTLLCLGIGSVNGE